MPKVTHIVVDGDWSAADLGDHALRLVGISARRVLDDTAGVL